MDKRHSQLSEHLVISRLITGLWQVADSERQGNSLELDSMAKAMSAYANAGLTTFDMADHYGSAEDIAGIFLKRYAKEARLKMLTKWVPTPGAVSKRDVRSAIERSLKRLQVECLDLLQFHTWSYSDPSWLDCLFYLQELKTEGLISELGLTNFDSVHLNMVLQSGIRVVSNQVCFSLLDQRAAAAMTELCLKHNVKILAYGTVAGGLLSERWLNQPAPGADATWSQMKYKRFIDVTGGWEVFQELLQTLASIAKAEQVSIATLASRYILEQAAVAAVIIGARLGSSEYIHESLRLFDTSLTEQSHKAIREALAKLQPIPGDCGDEYRKAPFLTASGDLSHHLESFPSAYPVQTTSSGRSLVLSGTAWETLAGFCRAIRQGNRIIISGTTATHQNRCIGGSDPTAQTHFIIDKLEGVLHSLGSRLEDVVRTRVYVKNLSDWEAVARAHGQRFKEILPANTLVQAQLVGDAYLVEIEAEAIAT